MNDRESPDPKGILFLGALAVMLCSGLILSERFASTRSARSSCRPPSNQANLGEKPKSPVICTFENMATAITAILAALLLMANGFVTFHLLKSKSYESIQIGLQVAIVWLLPIVGAYIVWQFLRSAKASDLPRTTNNDEALADIVYLESSTDSHVDHETNVHD